MTIAVSLAIAVAGCTQTVSPPLLEPQADARRWPPPPARARIRFVGTIASAKDLNAPTNLWQRIVGQAPAAKLVAPTDVAVGDDGVLFVLDTDARAVHRFDLTGRRHEMLGADHLTLPAALCWGAGRLFVADAQAGALFTWSPQRGWQRFDRDPPQRPAGLVYVEPVRTLYVSDLAARTIRAYDLGGRLVNTFDSGQARLGSPTHLAYHPAVGLLVSDSLGARVVRFDAEGRFLGAIGSPGDGSGNLSLPKGVAVDSQGHVYVVDARFENVQVFDPQGRILMAFGGEGTGDGEFWLPAGMCIDDKNRIWIADTYNCRVQVFEFLGAGSDEPKVAVNR
ncbi:MAG: 6-bladed beta-propeller [Planctomycetota bacterium]|jgi:sugar lactone lactonase YvrE